MRARATSNDHGTDTTDPAGPAGTAGPVSNSVGAVLGSLTAFVGRHRRAAKPLHPEGEIHDGVVERVGLVPPVGVDWLDRAGRDKVLLRRSRSAGLPAPLPDVYGLAVRVPFADGAAGDLLFSTTGAGRLSRFLLRPVRAAGTGATYSTLLPYRTPTGPLLLAARAGGNGTRFDLLAARPTGRWRRFGTLTIGDRWDDPDPEVSFDAMCNIVPGLVPPAWVKALRERSYAAARHTRGDAAPV